MNDDAILRGVNYASGGAGILNETGIYFVGHLLHLPQHQLLHVSILNTTVLNLQIQKLSFDDQISCFETTKVAITRKIGKLAAKKLCNDALYFVGLGTTKFDFLLPVSWTQSKPFILNPFRKQWLHKQLLAIRLSGWTHIYPPTIRGSPDRYLRRPINGTWSNRKTGFLLVE